MSILECIEHTRTLYARVFVVGERLPLPTSLAGQVLHDRWQAEELPADVYRVDCVEGGWVYLTRDWRETARVREEELRRVVS